MDAASNRGVDEMAQLLEQAVYAPSNARFKIYMIDEVHMLTNHAFNSMLKTLEEPPEHVKFILATTDPQKIPVTVLSRCLQFNLKQMPPGHIVSNLDNILGQEGIEFETPALRLLAQGAHGSMRDALSLTDQAIAYAAGKVTLEAVQGMLGALDQSYLVRLLDALAAKDGTGLLAVADEMATRSLSYNGALQDLGSLLHQIALAQSVPSAVPDDLPEREAVMRLASEFDPEEVQLFYQIAVHGRNELGLAPDEYAGFSMTLLRMLAFRPGMGGAESKAVSTASSTPAVARLNAAPQAVTSSTPITRTPTSSSTAMSPARAALEAARGGKAAASLPAARTSTNVQPSAPPPWEVEKPQTSARAEAETPNATASKEATIERSASTDTASQKNTVTEPRVMQPVPALNWDGNWPALAAALNVRGVVQQLAQQSELAQCDSSENSVQFKLRVPVETLCSAGSVDKLAATLSEHFGKVVKIVTEIGAVAQTANAQAQAERAARQKKAEETMHSDPFVQTMMREFGATIVPGSIKSIQ
jgi:DNA polymerase-3 subunit gamma/tau